MRAWRGLLSLLLAIPLACGGESENSSSTGGSGAVGGGTGGGTGGNGGTSTGGTGAGGTDGGGGSCSCNLPQAVPECLPDGSCSILSCAAAYADCDSVAANGCEASLANDPSHCGSCGNACSLASVCSQGSCQCSCPAGLTNCGGNQCFCADLTTDPANCGACAYACPVGSFCLGGTCNGGSGGTGGTGGSGGTGGVGGCPNAPVVGPEIVTGAPSWTASSWSVYVAPMGSTPAQFNQATMLVWANNHTFDVVKNVIKSSVAHPPPYTNELPSGLLAAGFTNSGCFSVTDWTPPSGILISTLLIPSASAPIDSSFETPGVNGPVIQFSALQVDADLYRDGQLIDPNFDSQYLKAAAIYDTGPFVAGFRHIPINFGENDAVSGGVVLGPGSFTLVVKMSELGNATEHSISFVVQP